MRFFFLAFLFVLLFLSEKVQGQAVSWGDQGNGTYINPILNADYSDPDVIRVGDKYYMVCSDFHYIGMPVLESILSCKARTNGGNPSRVHLPLI